MDGAMGGPGGLRGQAGADFGRVLGWSSFSRKLTLKQSEGFSR